jgi:hypothetical protein
MNLNLRTKESVMSILQQAGHVDYEWALPIWRAKLYALKAIVCVLMGRERGYDWKINSFDLAYFNFHEFTNYEAGRSDASFDVVAIPMGFRHWHYSIYHDGWL